MSDIVVTNNIQTANIRPLNGGDVQIKDNKKFDQTMQDYEAVYLSQMVSHMYEGVAVDPNFGGGTGEETMRSFLINEYGKQMEKAGGVGLAAQMKKQLLEQQEQMSKPQEAAGQDSTLQNNSVPVIAPRQKRSTMTEVETIANDAAIFLGTHADWERLTQQEITFLHAKNFEAAKTIMKMKTPLAERYQKQLKHLFDQKEALAVLPAATKEALKKSQRAFEKISAEYQHELDMALDSSRRFIEMIKSAITQQNTTSLFYGYSGTMNASNEVRSMVYNGKA